MDRHVIALFYDPADAARALESLVEQGVTHGEISLFSNEAGAADCRRSMGPDFLTGAAQGGVAGSTLALGGTIIAAGAGGSAILALGPLLLAAIASFGVGATIGGVVAALSRVGVPGPIAVYYDEEVCQSGALLLGAATLRHDAPRLGALLRRHGGANVMETQSPVFAF